VILIAGWTGKRGLAGLRLLFKPRPWEVQRAKYELLNDSLELETAGTVLDFGCGTGRSLVGIAPHIDPSSTTIGIDRFDDQIILGNTPHLASKNASKAGLDTVLLKGDGRELPLADNSMERIVVSQVLHDLPESTTTAILSELARVCTPDGRLGLIELPLVADAKEVQASYWPDRLTRAGFEVRTVDSLPWKEEKCRSLVVASPEG
jgi:ubiquinone/menaquinone biosynthesis C-methylase UbiE